MVEIVESREEVIPHNQLDQYDRYATMPV